MSDSKSVAETGLVASESGPKAPPRQGGDGKSGHASSCPLFLITNLGLRPASPPEVENLSLFSRRDKLVPQGLCPKTSRMTHHYLSLLRTFPVCFLGTCPSSLVILQTCGPLRARALVRVFEQGAYAHLPC